MGCTHERIKSVNCVLFCDICGVQVPSGWIADKMSAPKPEAVKPAEKPQETTSEKAPTATRKRTTKKGAGKP